jgi:hypothetical protein
MLSGKAPTKGSPQAGPIKLRDDLLITAPSGHFVNPQNSFLGRLQRAFPWGSPLRDVIGYRARAPMNLDFDLPGLADPILLHGLDRHPH